MPKIAIIFALMYFGGLIATFVADVSWGIYVYQVEYFLNPRSMWWYSYLPNMRYTFIIAVVILLSFVFKYNHYSKNRIFEIPQTKWFLMNVMYFALVSLWAAWPEMHFRTLENHIKLLIFLFIAYKTIDSPSKFKIMLWCFIFGNFYLGWHGHSMGRTLGTFDRMEGFGPTDSGGDGNNTALILVSVIPLLIYYITIGKNWQKVLSLFFMAYVLDAIVLVNSRGAFIAMVVSLGYLLVTYLFFTPGVVFRQKLLMVGGVLVGAAVFIYMTDAIFWQRMLSLQEATETAKAGGGRSMFWAKAIELANRFPFGVGTWGYQYYSPEFIPQAYLTGGRRAVHSLYFQCLAERGYFGSIFFAGLVMSNFFFLRKVKRFLREIREFDLFSLAIAIEACFIAYLAGSIFLNRLHAEVLYWLMMFIACFGNIFMFKVQKQMELEKIDQ